MSGFKLFFIFLPEVIIKLAMVDLTMSFSLNTTKLLHLQVRFSFKCRPPVTLPPQNFEIK